MRYLVIGASGFLGAHCYRLLTERSQDAAGTYRRAGWHPGLRRLDLASRDAVRRVMFDIEPDAVLWCAKHTSEGEDEEAILRNGLQAVIDAAGPAMRLVFVSTDGVFPGTRGPYNEDEEVVPIGSSRPVARYTDAKIEAERRIAASCRNACIVRVGPIYGRAVDGGWDPRVRALIDEWGRGRPVRRAVNVHRSFIHVEDLARGLCELAELDERGIFHFGPDRSASYYDFAAAAAQAFGYDPGLAIPYAVSEEDIRDGEIRADTTLDSARSRSLLSTRFRTVEEAFASADERRSNGR